MGLQGRQDKLSQSQFGNILNALNIQGMTKGMKGDQFVSMFTPDVNYVFSQSDANTMVTDAAKAAGVTLSSDQISRAASGISVVDAKDLRAEADKTFRRMKLDETDAILSARDEFYELLAKDSPVTGSIAKDKLARMVQPVGILTEEDLGRVAGSRAIRDRFEESLEELDTGKLSKTTITYLKDAVDSLSKVAAERKRAAVDTATRSLADQFKITPEDVQARTLFGTVLENIPEGLGLDPTAQAPTYEPGSTVQGQLSDGTPVEGTIERVIGDEAIVKTPDGNILKVRIK